MHNLAFPGPLADMLIVGVKRPVRELPSLPSKYLPQRERSDYVASVALSIMFSSTQTDQLKESHGFIG